MRQFNRLKTILQVDFHRAKTYHVGMSGQTHHATKPVELTFGAAESATLTLNGLTEQFTNQVGVTEFSQHDLAFQYSPGSTGAAIKFAYRIYKSDDPITLKASDSVWHPVVQFVDDGFGNKDPQVKVYRQPSAPTATEVANPVNNFFLGGKKIRFGLTEEGTPGVDGTIDRATLISRTN